jgi:hypothetical protein
MFVGYKYIFVSFLPMNISLFPVVREATVHARSNGSLSLLRSLVAMVDC